MRTVIAALGLALVAVACSETAPVPVSPPGSTGLSGLTPAVSVSPPNSSRASGSTPGPSAAPTSDELAILTFAGTGFEQGPAWYNYRGYRIEMTGPDHVQHVGYFHVPAEGSFGPYVGVVGDLPVEIGFGTYSLAFVKTASTDVASLRPVPGGTPRTWDEIYRCSMPLDVIDETDLLVHVDFGSRSCSATVDRSARASARLTIDGSGFGSRLRMWFDVRPSGLMPRSFPRPRRAGGCRS